MQIQAEKEGNCIVFSIVEGSGVDLVRLNFMQKHLGNIKGYRLVVSREDWEILQLMI